MRKNSGSYETQHEDKKTEKIAETLELPNAGFPVDNQSFDKNKRATWMN